MGKETVMSKILMMCDAASSVWLSPHSLPVGTEGSPHSYGLCSWSTAAYGTPT